MRVELHRRKNVSVAGRRAMLGLMALSEADRIAILEEIARDEGVKPSTRLRAMEEIGRLEARRSVVPAPAAEGESAPDPMADLDEMESARQKRVRHKRAARV
jgi:hypothetical protein